MAKMYMKKALRTLLCWCIILHRDDSRLKLRNIKAFAFTNFLTSKLRQQVLFVIWISAKCFSIAFCFGYLFDLRRVILFLGGSNEEAE